MAQLHANSKLKLIMPNFQDHIYPIKIETNNLYIFVKFCINFKNLFHTKEVKYEMGGNPLFTTNLNEIEVSKSYSMK